MDESFIYERLKALSGGLERAEYRDISKAFAEVIRYNQKALEELEERLRRELRDVSERFYLYGAVAPAGDASMINDFLFPMDEGREEGSIATVFCQCSPDRMKALFTGSHRIEAETEEGSHEITVRLRPCRRYKKKIEELQNLYYDNGVYWRTPYLPYVDRFADVYCEAFQPDFEIQGIRFMDVDMPVRTDLIPLWNVEPIHLKCTVFPIPAIDERNYQHTIRLPFWQDGYLVRMEKAVKHVYMSTDGLEIVSDEKVQKEFELYRIAVRRNINIPHFPLTTNYRQMRHIDRQADNAAFRIRTKAEIGRIITGYEAAEGLELLGIEEGGRGQIGQRGNAYRYIPEGRESLLLRFGGKKESFLSEDQVLFLVEEVQSYYPQFLVTGELSF